MEIVGGLHDTRRNELERALATYLHEEAGIETDEANRGGRDLLADASSRMGAGLLLVAQRQPDLYLIVVDKYTLPETSTCGHEVIAP